MFIHPIETFDDALERFVKGSRGVRMEKILEAMEATHRRVASKSSGERVEAGLKVKG